MAYSAQTHVLEVPELVDGILQQLTFEGPVHNAEPSLEEFSGFRPNSSDKVWDMPSLRCSSLVSKAWYRLAIRYIFYTFCAEFGRSTEQGGRGPNGGRTAPLLHFLHFSPHIRAVVRKVYLYTRSGQMDSEYACRKALDRIIAMFPQLEVLRISGSLFRSLGSPSTKLVHYRKFSPTLRKLVINGMCLGKRLGGDSNSFELSYSRCHLRSVLDLLAQFRVVKELAISSVTLFLDAVDGRHTGPSWELESLVCDGFKSVGPTPVLSQLCTPSTTSLHLNENATIALGEITTNISNEVASAVQHLSFWTSFSLPESTNTTIDFQRFNDLQQFTLLIPVGCPKSIPVHSDTSLRFARSVLSSFLSFGRPFRLLELKLVATRNPDNLRNHLHELTDAVRLNGIEDLLKDGVERKRIPFIRIGYYCRPWAAWHCSLCPVSAMDELQELFPDLDRLGYLRFN